VILKFAVLYICKIETTHAFSILLIITISNKPMIIIKYVKYQIRQKMIFITMIHIKNARFCSMVTGQCYPIRIQPHVNNILQHNNQHLKNV